MYRCIYKHWKLILTESSLCIYTRTGRGDTRACRTFFFEETFRLSLILASSLSSFFFVLFLNFITHAARFIDNQSTVRRIGNEIARERERKKGTCSEDNLLHRRTMMNFTVCLYVWCVCSLSLVDYSFEIPEGNLSYISIWRRASSQTLSKHRELTLIGPYAYSLIIFSVKDDHLKWFIFNCYFFCLRSTVECIIIINLQTVFIFSYFFHQFIKLRD